MQGTVELVHDLSEDTSIEHLSVETTNRSEYREPEGPRRFPREGFITEVGDDTFDVTGTKMPDQVMVGVQPENSSVPESAVFLRKRSFFEDEGDGPTSATASPGPSKPGSQVVEPRVSATDPNAPRRRTLFDVNEKVLKPQWKEFLLNAVESPAVSIFMTIVTLWALFGDDLRLIVTHKADDEVFEGITIFMLVVFSLELIALSIAKDEYFLSFYFVLDLVATFSLIFDINAVVEGMLGDSTASTEDPTLGSATEQSDAAGEAVNVAGTSKNGARAARAIRIVRLVRILKLYKQYVKRQEEQAAKELQAAAAEEEFHDSEKDDGPESRVGKKLSDLTTRRVIIGVLLMLFIIPLFDIDYWQQATSLNVGGLPLVVDTYVATGKNAASDSFLNILDAYVNKTEGMYWLVIDGTPFNKRYKFKGPAHRELRRSEFEESTVLSMESFAKFDTSDSSEWQAILNILKTLFVCIVLGLGAWLFNRDANNLVIYPLERMIDKVKIMAKNPMAKFAQDTSNDDGEQQFETKILENSFVKVCSLLSVGFGDAGAEIIAENMSSGGDLDPMIPGKKMVAIFGFCDIRQFTDATETLQEGVMEFVNSIGQIVHMEVALHGGSANKNIGDAFLLVWKFDPEVTLDEIEAAVEANQVDGPRGQLITSVADKALASFIIMISMLKKSARLRAYGKNEELCKKMPNYAVKMGFGLHVGWAIEGAIGSKYKVDASYLSPNVNMAARLEAATKQFGVPILLSEHFMSICSTNARKRCRQIDRVTVKGSTQPMGLFTYDVDDTGVQVDLDDPLYKEKPDKFTLSHVQYKNEFVEHPDISQVTAVTPEFLAQFGEGYQAYQKGDWPTAVRILKHTLTCRKTLGGAQDPVKDGPSQSLLDVMADHGNVAPSDWKGYRELTEK
mmetsp:Transcript_33782/g.40808  ORF Transcript_33782/g.40808 Transcript_33782/m.40808 type:complete len:903 (+) Transcript_33782:122-2830(+)